jgi:shikimate dehydrogenase
LTPVAGDTCLAGIVGWPLRRTLSPALQNAAFRALGLDWIYLAFPVPPEALRDAIGGLRALGVMGANVTMPHKESVVALLDRLSGDARAVAAVNTIQRVGDRLVGHNTDVDGFRGFLSRDAGVAASGSSALVLGSGGAARAVVCALDGMGAARIVVAGRDIDRARAVARVARAADARALAWLEAASLAGSIDIVVNATPLGGAGEAVLEGARFGPGQTVVDLVYAPPTTPLVERARAAGARAWGGLGMLIHQGAASFRIWTGQEPPFETMSAAALRALGASSP